MTKARDLANAGTALTTVSATELGYLDGVTSAVQTQLNAKAVYPSQTGNSGKYLTTDGTDPSWGAVPASGLTLISSVRYTGASSYNIDNVLSSTYDAYFIALENVYLDAGAKMTMALRYGTSTQTASYKYATFGWKYSGITWNNGSSASTSAFHVAGPGYISSSFFNLTIKSSGWVSLSGTGANSDDGSFAFGGILPNVSQTWTGLQFSNTNAGTLNADISIYGRAK